MFRKRMLQRVACQRPVPRRCAAVAVHRCEHLVPLAYAPNFAFCPTAFRLTPRLLACQAGTDAAHCRTRTAPACWWGLDHCPGVRQHDVVPIGCDMRRTHGEEARQGQGSRRSPDRRPGLRGRKQNSTSRSKSLLRQLHCGLGAKVVRVRLGLAERPRCSAAEEGIPASAEGLEATRGPASVGDPFLERSCGFEVVRSRRSGRSGQTDRYLERRRRQNSSTRRRRRRIRSDHRTAISGGRQGSHCNHLCYVISRL